MMRFQAFAVWLNTGDNAAHLGMVVLLLALIWPLAGLAEIGLARQAAALAGG